MTAAARSISQLRLRLKRVFSAYYLDVCSTGIADPGEAYEAIRDYFEARSDEVGSELLHSQLRREVDALVGEIEQDLRQRHAARVNECLQAEPIDARFDECLEASWRPG